MLFCCNEMARGQLKGFPYLIQRQSYTSIVEVGSIVHKELQILIEGVESSTKVTCSFMYACKSLHRYVLLKLLNS